MTLRLPRVPFGMVIVALALVTLVALQLPAVQHAIAAAGPPPRVADAAAVASQRSAAEHALQRSFAKASKQLTDTRQLNLPISKTEADALQARALDDLRTIRRSGLAAIAQVTHLAAAELDAYVRSTDAALETGTFDQETGVLLAPDLYTVVSRAGDLSQQVADNATRAMTRAPSPSPSPSPTPRR
jgi:hypothetical protein